MTIHYQDSRVTLHHGDCLDVLRSMPDSSVDAVVTDPPYGLGFMGREWDALPPGEEWAAECLRVLKPGGHLLAFGGTRTWHRLACAVEDAGFEIRDGIAWLYGSGFPKSLDVSKAIDKMDATHERRARALRFTAWMRSTGITSRQIDDATGTNMGGHYLTANSQPAVATVAHLDMLRPLLPKVPEWVEEMARQRTVESQAFASRDVVGAGVSGKTYGMGGLRGVETSTGEFDVTAPATEAARQWAGWGTALKPAFEPVVVARKPLTGTVAGNVLEWGTGALNIDGCRIEGVVPSVPQPDFRHVNGVTTHLDAHARNGQMSSAPGGRWPANVVLDEAMADVLDEQSGTLTSGKMRPTHTTAGVDGRASAYGKDAAGGFTTMETYGDSGGASRFFKVAESDGDDHLHECPDCQWESEQPDLPIDHLEARFKYVAKAPKRERPVVDGVAHPTVKPLTLMRWLVRLVTPPGGVVLEPFAGSGTTVEACLLEGVKCVAIEKGDEYLPLIVERIHRQDRARIADEVTRRPDPEKAIVEQVVELGLFDLDDEETAS